MNKLYVKLSNELYQIFSKINNSLVNRIIQMKVRQRIFYLLYRK